MFWGSLVGSNAVMCLVNEIRLLDLPCRRGNHVVVIADLQPIFQDAADFDAGQREDHGVDLEALGLDVRQVGGLGRKRNDRAIRVDGAALDVGHLEAAALVGNADRRQLLALLGEHFDAHVVAVVVEIIVRFLFAIEVHRIGARRFGVGGHLQFFFCRRLELSMEKAGNAVVRQQSENSRAILDRMSCPLMEE